LECTIPESSSDDEPGENSSSDDEPEKNVTETAQADGNNTGWEFDYGEGGGNGDGDGDEWGSRRYHGDQFHLFNYLNLDRFCDAPDDDESSQSSSSHDMKRWELVNVGQLCSAQAKYTNIPLVGKEQEGNATSQEADYVDYCYVQTSFQEADCKNDDCNSTRLTSESFMAEDHYSGNVREEECSTHLADMDSLGMLSLLTAPGLQQ
jgi:hypothetical protein